MHCFLSSIVTVALACVVYAQTSTTVWVPQFTKNNSLCFNNSVSFAAVNISDSTQYTPIELSVFYDNNAVIHRQFLKSGGSYHTNNSLPAQFLNTTGLHGVCDDTRGLVFDVASAPGTAPNITIDLQYDNWGGFGVFFWVKVNATGYINDVAHGWGYTSMVSIHSTNPSDLQLAFYISQGVPDNQPLLQIDVNVGTDDSAFVDISNNGNGDLPVGVWRHMGVIYTNESISSTPSTPWTFVLDGVERGRFGIYPPKPVPRGLLHVEIGNDNYQPFLKSSTAFIDMLTVTPSITVAQAHNLFIQQSLTHNTTTTSTNTFPTVSSSIQYAPVFEKNNLNVLCNTYTLFPQINNYDISNYYAEVELSLYYNNNAILAYQFIPSISATYVKNNPLPAQYLNTTGLHSVCDNTRGLVMDIASAPQNHPNITIDMKVEPALNGFGLFFWLRVDPLAWSQCFLTTCAYSSPLTIHDATGNIVIQFILTPNSDNQPSLDVRFSVNGVVRTYNTVTGSSAQPIPVGLWTHIGLSYLTYSGQWLVFINGFQLPYATPTNQYLPVFTFPCCFLNVDIGGGGYNHTVNTPGYIDMITTTPTPLTITPTRLFNQQRLLQLDATVLPPTLTPTTSAPTNTHAPTVVYTTAVDAAVSMEITAPTNILQRVATGNTTAITAFLLSTLSSASTAAASRFTVINFTVTTIHSLTPVAASLPHKKYHTMTNNNLYNISVIIANFLVSAVGGTSQLTTDQIINALAQQIQNTTSVLNTLLQAAGYSALASYGLSVLSTVPASYLAGTSASTASSLLSWFSDPLRIIAVASSGALLLLLLYAVCRWCGSPASKGFRSMNRSGDDDE